MHCFGGGAGGGVGPPQPIVSFGFIHQFCLLPDDTQLKHKTTYHYDRFGHRIRAAVAAAKDTTGSTTETRCDYDTVTYDTAGRYVVAERDCLNRACRAVSAHNGWGQPLTETQRLNADSTKTRVRTTTHTYTAGGWLAVSRESTGAWTGQFRARRTSSVSHCPTNAAYYIETRQAGGGRGLTGLILYSCPL